MKKRRTMTATDLGLDFDRMESARRPPSEWIFLGLAEPWDMVEHARVHLGMESCPVCGGSPLQGRRYCLICDRSSFDGEITFPGLPVDRYPNLDYPRESEAPVYAPTPGLKGGKGESKTRTTRQKRRAPHA
jgi:hypothetical protein